MTPLSLYELNRMVSEVLTLSLNDSYWIVAEIASLNEHISGHCYLELVDKGGTQAKSGSRIGLTSNKGGQFKAQARATVWRTAWSKIQPKFHKATGDYLAAGMKVLLEVKVTFHEVYGYSLNVSDIDPSYTLGDMARRRQEIIQQLDDDGILTLNKELQFPRPLQRIAVISAAGAAGYGDFCNQLDESGFRFSTRLFAATMQGKDVEASIIAALDAIANEADHWDCVVIIRGGGSVSDLNGFESYLLAANVAQFPLPVLTGIGHERDDTVVDIVAHTRLKTPTAVAQFLIDKMGKELQNIEELEQALTQCLRNKMLLYRKRYDTAAYRLERAASSFAAREREHLVRLSARIEKSCTYHLQHQHHAIDSLTNTYIQGIRRLLEGQSHKLQLLEHAIKLSGPERILKMGYSITTDAEGNVIKSPQDAVAGSIIKTQLYEGSITSKVLP